MELDGTVAVVTGAGGGIGRELVSQLVDRGARVAAVDIAQDRLDGTAAAVAQPERVTTHVVDITDRDAVLALPAELIDVHGVIDVLINNAGVIQPFVPLVDLDFDVVDRMVDVNLHGTVNMCKAFLPHLLDRRAAHLVNVASMGSYVPFPGQTMYGAAKAGVRLLTEGLYAELLGTSVGVTVVMPGATATDISANSGVVVPGIRDADASTARTTSAPDAARIILDGIEDGALHVYVGPDAKLMQAAVKIAPQRAIHLIRRQMRRMLDS